MKDINYKKFFARHKINSFLLIFFCIFAACSSIGSSQSPHKNKSAEYLTNVTDQQNFNTNYNISSSAANNQNINSNKAVIPEIKSPYQKKQRRKIITFPNDCQYAVVGSSKDWKEISACAAALEYIQPALQKLAKSENCDTSFKDILSFDYAYAVNFYPFSNNKYLVEMRCWTAAYNLSNVYLLYDESAIPAKTRVMEFPDLKFLFDKDDKSEKYPTSFEKVTVKSVPGRIFNTKTKELLTMDKSTGIGYTGHFARYSFPNGEPKLEEYRAKFKEDGNGLGDNWLKVIEKTWKRYYPK